MDIFYWIILIKFVLNFNPTVTGFTFEITLRIHSMEYIGCRAIHYYMQKYYTSKNDNFGLWKYSLHCDTFVYLRDNVHQIYTVTELSTVYNL